jgi:hypothetical protein
MQTMTPAQGRAVTKGFSGRIATKLRQSVHVFAAKRALEEKIKRSLESENVIFREWI